MKVLVLFCCFGVYLSQTVKPINQSIASPAYIKNLLPPLSKKVQSDVVFSIEFPEINYEISSQFFFTNQTNTVISINKTDYDQKNPLQKQCQLYPTTLSGDISEYDTFESYPIKHCHCEQSFKLYVVTYDLTLMIYNYTSESLEREIIAKIPNEVIKVEEGEIEKFAMMQFKGNFYIFSSQGGFLVDKVSNFKKLQNFDKIPNGFSGIFDLNQSQLWVSGYKSICIYKVVNDSIQFFNQINAFTEQPISGVMMEQKKNSKIFYVTTVNKLFILSVKEGQLQNQEEFDLNGTCTEIQKIKNVLFLGCTYERLSFVMELEVSSMKSPDNNHKVSLNRFYDDRTVDGIRKVEPFGLDKIILMGGDTALIIGEAVNRNVLLDLAKQSKIQRSDLQYAFGLVDIINILSLSNGYNSTLIILKNHEIVLYKVFQDPPEMECQFNIEKFGKEISGIIVFNTTHCPYSANDPTTSGGTRTICETYYQYKFSLSQNYIQKTTANLAVFCIILLFVLLIFIFMGWCYRFRNNADSLMWKLQKKIEKMRKKKEGQELKQI